MKPKQEPESTFSVPARNKGNIQKKEKIPGGGKKKT